MPEPICPVCAEKERKDCLDFVGTPLIVCDEHEWDGHEFWQEHAEHVCRNGGADSFAAVWYWAVQADYLMGRLDECEECEQQARIELSDLRAIPRYSQRYQT